MSLDSLYERYVYERLGQAVLRKEFGFITYKITNKECFIVDMYIDFNLRKTGLGKQLLEDLVSIAKSKGCDVVTSNIHLFDKGANNTLKAAMSCGFRVENSGAGVLLIAKELKE